MSKIDELINRLCPNGVPVSILGDVASVVRGSNITRDAATLGSVPVLAGGQKPAYWHDVANRDGENVVVAGSGAYAGFVSYWNQPIWVSDAFSVSGKNGVLQSKFCFYLLKNRQDQLHSMKKGSGVPHVYPKDVARLEIPVPPLEVQKEIVSILDKFTQLEAELEAELEARRTQYEVTRDRLLGFSNDLESHPIFEFDKEPAVDKIKKLRLTDVCEYSSSKVASTDLLADQYIGVEQLLQNRMGRVKSMKVPSVQNLTAFQPGDVLLGNIRPYLKKIWFATEHGGCGGDVLVVSLKSTAAELLIPRYLFHLLSSDRFFEYNVQHSKGAKMPRGSKKAIMEFHFGLPPKETQAQIISILDKLDALVNDIKIGLPAEIAARRKQYEYYRNKLLTFKELDAA